MASPTMTSFRKDGTGGAAGVGTGGCAGTVVGVVLCVV